MGEDVLAFGQHQKFLPHVRKTSGTQGMDKIKAWCTKFQSSLLNIYPVCYSIHSHLFTSVMGWIGVQTAPNYGTMPIWYVTLHFQDWH